MQGHRLRWFGYVERPGDDHVVVRGATGWRAGMRLVLTPTMGDGGAEEVTVAAASVVAGPDGRACTRLQLAGLVRKHHVGETEAYGGKLLHIGYFAR